MSKAFSYILLAFIFHGTFAVQGQTSLDKKHKNSGFLDFNGYYDTREFSVMTVNILAKLAHNFQYFSLTNYQGNSQSPDLQGFYSEQNIRWNVKEGTPIDLTAQWVVRNGIKNDNLRFGIRVRFNKIPELMKFFDKLHLSYSANLHVLELRPGIKLGYNTQLEHVYRLNILPNLLNNRLSLTGFADQNFVYEGDEKPVMKWVSEHQLGFMTFDHLYIVLEYRINDYLPSDNYGLGYGIAYKINF